MGLLSAYIRRDFPSLGLYRSYLDTARVGLMPGIVREEGARSLAEYVADPLSRIPDVGWKYEYLRRGLARLIGAPGPGSVTVMGSTTSCITRMVASILVSASKSLGPLRVAATIHEYPGVILSLESLCRSLPHACAGFEIVGGRGRPDWEDDAAAFFEEGPGVLVASSVAWVTGYVPRLDTVGRAARRAGGFLVVDAAQQLGHLPMEPEPLGVDVLCGTTKKWMLSPLSSMGVAYIGERVIRDVTPYIVGMHNVETGELSLCDPTGPGAGGFKLKSDADRFMSIGRPSLFSIETAITVLDFLLNISMAAIRDHVLSLRKEAEDIIRDAGMRVELDDLPFERKSGIILVDLGLSPARTYEACRRLARRGIAVSCRGQAGYYGVRVSVHIYNNGDDVRVFAEEARRVVRELG